MFDPNYSYIACPNCGGKLQALMEYDYGLDTDLDRLSVIYGAHKAECTPQQPWTADPNAYYGN